VIARRQDLRRGSAQPRDRGALALELLIVFPAVLLAVLAALSAGLWFHAKNVALSAAEEGVRVARGHDNPGDGVQAARAFAVQSGDGILLRPEVVLGGDADTIEITVNGEAVSLVPGLTLSISQTARAPRERWTAP
jgi:Flp pilus assembly protein TadG